MIGQKPQRVTSEVFPDREIEHKATKTFPSLADRVVILAGPTASGKSATGLECANDVKMTWKQELQSLELQGGEIVSVDSMAVYRGMDIGSAKPTADERQQVPHHLIDIVDPDQSFSVAEFLSAAHQAVAAILQRGKVPILVGGTPMYLKGLLRGFDPGPPADLEFRREVLEDVERFGVEALYQRLQQVDPLSAWKIDPGDVRRMVRALEVWHLTGRPISHRQIQFEASPRPQAPYAFWLHWKREQLHRRINARTKALFQQGLVQEVKGLLERYGKLSETAQAGVGYREVIELIESGQSDNETAIAQCVETVTAHTRRLARRQETWLRGLKEIQPIEVSGDGEAITETVLGMIKELSEKR